MQNVRAAPRGGCEIHGDVRGSSAHRAEHGGVHIDRLAPVHTDTITRSNAEFMQAMAEPRVKDILAANSAEPGRMSPRQFADYLAQEVRVWGDVVRAAGVKID